MSIMGIYMLAIQQHRATTLISNWQSFATIAARLLVCCCLAILLFSNFLVNQLAATAVVFAILAGQWQQKWVFVRSQPFVLLSIALLALLIIATFYSTSMPVVLTKYTKILYLLFFLPLFTDKQSRIYAINAFMAGVLVAVFISYLGYFNWFDIIPFVKTHPLIFPAGSAKWPNMIVNANNFSALTAFLAFLLLNKFADAHRYRSQFIYGVLLLLVLYYLLAISGQRTGSYTFILLLLLFTWQRKGMKQLLLGIIALPILTVCLYFAIPAFNNKVAINKLRSISMCISKFVQQ